MEICDLTVLEAKEKLEKRVISAIDLVKSCLKRIEKVESSLNSFITQEADSALKQAEEVDKDRKDCQKLGPLAGIPFGVKDIFCTKGIETTAASKILGGFVPPYDSTVVRKLKESGAIIIGKTNCDAFAHGSSGENSDFGPTRNPYNLDCVPGGSSSGSATAVASGECLFATGTDTGSSIRLPAGFCNLVGMKPTYGLVSRYGIIAMTSSLDSPGVLTRTIQDQALILGIIAGYDPLDSNSAASQNIKPVWPLPEGNPGLLKNIKIGLPKEYFGQGIGGEVQKVLDQAIRFYQNLGAAVKEISLPHTEYGIAAYYIICMSETSSNLARNDGIRFPLSVRSGKDAIDIYFDTREKGFGSEAKRRIMLGTYALSAGFYEAYYEKAARVRNLIRLDFEKAFREVDLILTPTSPTLPFKIGEKVDNPLQMYLSDIFMVPVNLAGIAGLGLPAGFNQEGLPIGMQLIGPRFSEQLLLEVGLAYEKQQDWVNKRPKICTLL